MTEAPRWRLINAHYLNIKALADGTQIEWEHKETARESGRTVRKVFKVPALLDPNEPNDQNYPGEIVVAHEVEGARNERNDIIFYGEPTPEMEPLNDEATALSDSLRQKWEHPINSLPANGGMNDREMAFMKQMMESFTGGAANPANAAVPKAQYDELKDRLTKLEAMLADKAKPEAPARRV